MSDLAERLADLQEKNEQPHGLTDEEAKETYLRLLSEGVPLAKAARDAGRSATWFKRRRNPEGANYDPAFTVAFDEITAPGGEYKSALVEDVFSAYVREAKEGNVRAAEKLLAAYHPDFNFIRQQSAQGALNVEQLQVFFGELPLEKLLELKQAREAQRMKELPVIDQ